MADSTVRPIRTPVGILSFPSLFEARSPAPGADPRFQINLLFDKEAQQSDEYKTLQGEIIKCAKEAFGDDIDFGSIRLPLRNAGEKKYNGYDEGSTFIAPWSKSKPGLVDGRLQELYDSNDVWAGQKARATVKPFPYNTSGNRGVSLALNNVQIVVKDMPRMDGRVAANEDFDLVDGENEGANDATTAAIFG